ncbi:MAG: Na-translocating system protein MpsC family protein [Planctomycetota bacterium]
MVEFLWVFDHVGISCAIDFRDGSGRQGRTPLHNPTSNMAQQIAQVAKAFEQERTGHRPKSVTVVLSDDTLVITLHGALSEAEKALAKNPDGAAKVQEFHRQLFTSAAGTLRQEIERITGVKVREATAEIEPSTGTVVRAFASGTVVQVFLLADKVETDVWSNDQPSAKE